jgi:hypothetical protein
MRMLCAALIATAVISQPAGAANTDPRAYVLRATEVPAHYFVDKDNTTLLSKRMLETDPASRRAVERSGFVTGYYSRYLNSDPPRWRYIVSAAYLLRTPEGAKTFLSWMDKKLRAMGAQRHALHLGDAAFGYLSPAHVTGTWIVWRSGKVVALLSCQLMTGHWNLAVALAAKQQRRIAAALG